MRIITTDDFKDVLIKGTQKGGLLFFQNFIFQVKRGQKQHLEKLEERE
tara:strand:+ start:418 stop:561 length:144 start_codon:yes stop_codon:yes gene_type:complete